MKKIHDLSSSEAINQIETLYKTKKSGTLFLMTEKNIMVQIMLTEGNIVAVHYLTQRGIDALELIFETATFVLCDFRARDKSAMDPNVDPQLPSMSNIFDAIKKAQKRVVNSDGTQVKSHSNGSAINLTEVTEIIVKELTLHLGPIAAMLCEEHLEHAHDLHYVMSSLDNIAGEIENAAKETEFKRLVTEKIQAL